MSMSTLPVRADLLSVQGVSKRYAGVQALVNVGFSLRRGEVLALAGHNGAGKSTLIGVLAGTKRPDSGTIMVEGVERVFADPGQARAAGIGVCYQEPFLVPELSVEANVLLNMEGVNPFLNRAEIHERFQDLVKRTGIDLPATRPVSALSIAQKQLTQILRSLAGGAQIVILDEPTAALSPQDRTRLFELIKALSKTSNPTSFVLVSHFLQELEDNCDRAVVLRNGRVVATTDGPPKSRELASLMAGSEAEALDSTPAAPAPIGDVLLRIAELEVGSTPPLTLTVASGEIVGLAGLVGSGRTELLRAIGLGSDRRSGDVLVAGHSVTDGRSALAHGLALLPEDRRDALLADWPIWKNVTLPGLGTNLNGLLLRAKRERSVAARLAERCRVAASSVLQAVGELSGGNAQKVVFAKLLSSNFKVALLDEPTHGVDVHAKAEIFSIVDQLAAEGRGFVVVAAEFEDLLRMATTIYSIHKGQIVAMHTNRQTSSSVTAQTLLYEAATGRSYASAEGNQQ